MQRFSRWTIVINLLLFIVDINLSLFCQRSDTSSHLDLNIRDNMLTMLIF